MRRDHYLTCSLVLLVLGCQSAPESGGQTGLEGQVVISPAAGGPSPADQPDEAPWKATFTVSKSGRVVVRFSTDDQGRFRVALPPGTYTIALSEPRPGLREIVPFDVEVPPGRYEQVRWRFDIGIR